MHTATSKYLCVGPGGRKCRCCFPAPGSKDRRSQFRSAKRKAERIAVREALADMEDDVAAMREIERDVEYYSDSIEDTWNGDWVEGFDDFDDFDPYDYEDDNYGGCWHCGATSYDCRCDGNGPA